MATRKVTDAMLNDVIKAMSKSYGDGFATRGVSDVKYDAIPTGYDDLDSILTRGANGLFLGGIVEIYGEEGSGKCISKDTLCLTQDGLLSVEEIFEQNDLKCDDERGYIDVKYELYNELSDAEHTSYFYKNGAPCKTIRITTQHGFCIEGTPNHPIRVLDQCGNIVWRRLQNLQQGDMACVSYGHEIFSLRSKASIAQASLAGYLVSSAATVRPSTITFEIVDNQIASFYKDCIRRVFGDDIIAKMQMAGFRYIISPSDGNKDFLNDLCGVPRCIRTGSRDEQVAFVQSYFDIDGEYIPSSTGLIRFSANNLQILRQLQLMLLNMGIISTVGALPNQLELDSACLTIENPDSVSAYISQIGFHDNHKCNSIVKLISTNSDYNPNVVKSSRLIPHQKARLVSLYASIDPHLRTHDITMLFNNLIESENEINCRDLNRVIEVCVEILNRKMNGLNKLDLEYLQLLSQSKRIYSPIQTITEGWNTTYDFTLPYTHTFWSNGFISHNTSIAMRTVGMAQKTGHVCCWLDAESGFSPDLAIINGIDLPKLCMPDLAHTKATNDKNSKQKSSSFLNSAELLSMIYHCIMKDVFGLIVVDSVAGMMPERLLQDDADPNSIGMAELARNMSEYLKMINAACASKKCTVIFINQVRSIPGNMYKKEDTPGGKALKFFASQRLRVGKAGKQSGQDGLVVQKVDDEDIIIGHYAKVTVVKNKKAPPSFAPIEVPIYYRAYFPDDAKKCYDYARSLKVITIRNGVLTWKNDDGTLVLQSNGESDLLLSIRKHKLEQKLANACVEAEQHDRNMKLKHPIKLPDIVRTLSNQYDPNNDLQIVNTVNHIDIDGSPAEHEDFEPVD